MHRGYYGDGINDVLVNFDTEVERLEETSEKEGEEERNEKMMIDVVNGMQTVFTLFYIAGVCLLLVCLFFVVIYVLFMVPPFPESRFLSFVSDFTSKEFKGPLEKFERASRDALGDFMDEYYSKMDGYDLGAARFADYAHNATFFVGRSYLDTSSLLRCLSRRYSTLYVVGLMETLCYTLEGSNYECRVEMCEECIDCSAIWEKFGWYYEDVKEGRTK